VSIASRSSKALNGFWIQAPAPALDGSHDRHPSHRLHLEVDDDHIDRFGTAGLERRTGVVVFGEPKARLTE
jgi:hypothetical protein